MRSRILEHLEAARRWGAELEVRVAERTEELRQSQAAIVERERQIAALEAVRAATVTLSHHINNATAGIAGCCDVLASTLGDQTDWQLRYALDGILVSVKKITAVLQALRDLTQIELTPFPGGMEAIDMGAAIQERITQLRLDEQPPGKDSSRHLV
jgi:signal transduction histidine kinase